MKLFAVITTHHYEFSEIRGIYSTEEKAKARKSEVIKGILEGLNQNTDIEELELDIPVRD